MSNFTKADLVEANFTNADAHSSFALCFRASFSEADLTNANFRYAGLTSADLSGANFFGARFENTVLDDNARLAGALNIEHATVKSIILNDREMADEEALEALLSLARM